MNTEQLLAALIARKVQLYLKDGKLRASAPAGALDAQLKAALSERKQELISALAERELRAAGGPTPRDRAQPAPLSHAQERLWLLAALEPGSTAYHLPFVLQLTGALDVSALRAAFSALLSRHESLRSRLVQTGAGLVQEIAPAASCEPVLSGPEALTRAQLAGWLAQQAGAPFRLDRAPLLRAALGALAPEEHVLCFCLHHAVFDGWSVEIFVAELAQAYSAYARGEQPSWPALPVQYADYASFERSQAGRHWLQTQLDYHSQRLRALPALRLPGELGPRPGPARAAWQRALLDARGLGGARALARARGTSLFAVLLAGCFALLRRYTGSDDVCVGMPMANRAWSELDGIIGFFANTVVVRSQLAGDPSFAALLEDTHARLLEAQANQNVPFERVVQALAPARVPGDNPLFRVAFALHAAPRTPQLPGLAVEPLPAPRDHAMFELSILLTEHADALEIGVEHAAERFSPELIGRTAEHYARLLCGALAQPEARLSQLSLLGEPEREQWLQHAGVGTDWLPPCPSLTQRFAEQVRRAPGAIALCAEGRELSYAELDARSSWLAVELVARGVGPERAVALSLPRGVAQMVALVACLKAGGYYVPIDPEQPIARQRNLIERACAVLVLTCAGTTQPAAGAPGLDVEPFAHGPLPPQPSAAPLPPRHPEQLCYQLFTSGSSGEPKGVQVCDRAVLRLVTGQTYADFAPGETFLAYAPLAFDASTFEIWGALLSGARLALAPPGALSLAELGRVIVRERVSTLWLTAALFAQLVEHRLEDLAGVRQLLAGGEVLSPVHVARLQSALPGCRVVNGYGPTENTTFSSCHVVTAPVEPERPLPIGKPLAGSTAFVLDAWMQPVAAGVVGELYVGGQGLARGYAALPALTAERFVPSPFGPPGARLYRTGDLACVQADGALQFVGRSDAQIKLRGQRIELAELEHALMRCPGVRAAAAAVSGAGDARHLVAYVVGAAEIEALRRALAAELPAYMLPSQLVLLPRLPLTPNGKLDRRALPEPAAEPAALAQPAATQLEQLVLGLFGAELGHTRVGLHQDFFAAGGHSLLATRVIARIEALIGVQLPLRALFEQPTAAGLARAIEAARARGEPLPAPPSLVDAPSDGAPLCFAQEQLWLEERLSGQVGLYNVPLAIELRGPLNLPLLAAALDALVRRHGALRTAFEELDGVPLQRVQPELALELVPVAVAPDELGHWLDAEASRGFDLSRAPLFRVQLAALPGARHVLLWTLHHAIADGMSVSVLLRELGSAYTQLTRDEPVRWPEPALQLGAYARWERARAAAGGLADGLAHFLARLEGAPPLLELPADAPRPVAQTHRGQSLELPLGAALSAELRALALREGVTPFMLTCAAFAALLSRVTGQPDIVLGTPMANRARPGLAHAVGHFVNTIVLRLELGDDPSFRALLARTRSETLDAQAFEHVPFDRLVQAKAAPRDPAYTPLVQVLVAYVPALDAGLSLPGVEAQLLELAQHGAKFDLSLDAVERGAELWLRFEYAEPLLGARSVQRLAERMRSLLSAVVEDCSLCISRLPILPDDERAALLAAAGSPRPLPGGASVWGQFAAAARRAPSAIALRDGAHSTSYAQLWAAATALGAELRAAGIGAERGVALHLPRSPQLVAAVLGTLHAGGFYVPVDPELPLARRLMMLRGLRCAVIVALEDAQLAPELCAGRAVVRVGERPAEAASRALPAAPLHPEQLAYAVYTSGSTGEPKAALISQGSLLSASLAWQEAYALTHADRHLQSAQMSFDVFTGDWVRALCSGGQLVLCPRPVLLEPEALHALITREAISVAELVPALLRPLLELLEERDAYCPSVRLLVCGSDAWSPADYRRARTRFPHARVVNSYGLTEATVDSAWFYEQRDGAALARLPIGRPYPNARAYVLDAQLELAPLGVSGELCIGGPAVARGYAGRPDWTAERFVPDPWGPPGARLYRTGDRARLTEEGRLELLGRADGQIKLHGQRIELAEVEAALARVAGVRAGAVALHALHAGPRLVAYVVGTTDFARVRRELGERLPDYMLPRTFMSLPALPLTRHGKLDRRALPAPTAVEPELTRVEPRTPREQLLATLWRELLGVPALSIHDSFFELGGDSISSIQLVSRARKHGLSFTPRDVFTRRTLAALAEVAREVAASPAEQGPCHGPLVLAPLQRWFFAQGFEPETHWNQSVLLSVPPGVEESALRAACGALHAHHDALRLRFTRSGEVVTAHGSHDLQCNAFVRIDLAHTAAGAEPGAIEQACARVQAGLDLAAGRLWQLAWLDLGPVRRGRLLLVVHHLVVDAVSMRILLEDLRAAYACVSAGLPPALPDKTASYFSWTEQQLTAAKAHAPAERAQYAALAGTSGARLTPDDPAGSARERDLATCSVQLGRPDTERWLLQSGAAYRTSPEELLLAALASVMCAQTGEAHWVLDLEGHGREGPLDVARTVGWFTTLAPVRLDAPRGASARALICGIKEQLRRRPRPELYGQLRWLEGEQTAGPATVQLCFNYLGRLELSPAADDFTPSLESRGPERHPALPLAYELELTAHVSDGCLQLELGFARTRFAPARMQALLAQVIEALRGLLDHACSTEAFGYTPSDFPLAELDQAELDQLVQARRDIEDVYPATALQQGMLLHAQLAPEAGVYAEQLACTLAGPLDRQALARALQELVDAHPVLRSAFVWREAAEPLTLVLRDVRVQLQEQDVSGLAPAVQDALWRALLRADLRRGFELQTAPLLRTHLVRVADDLHRLVFSHHHALLDGWSLGLFMSELLARYAGARPAPHPPFRDYVALRRTQADAATRDYFARALRGARPVPLPREPGLGSEQATCSLSLSAELDVLARARGVTPSAALSAALALTLGAYLGSDDVVLGVTVSGRPPELAGVEQMLGLFIQTLPLRVRLDPAQPGGDYLTEVARRSFQLQEHDRLSLVELAKLADLEPGQALFDVLFVFENYPASRALLAGQSGLQLRELQLASRTNYPLTVAAEPGPEGCVLRALFARDALDPARAQALLERMRQVALALLRSPERRLGELASAPPALTVHAPTDFLPVHSRIAAVAARNPQALAVVQGSTALRYAELTTRARQLAALLRARGVGRERAVALLLPRCPEALWAMLAVLEAGGYYVPIDSDYPAERVASMLRASAPQLILSLSSCAAELPDGVETLCLDRLPAAPSGEVALPVTHPDQLAYVLYTSGSSGAPKGVAVSAGNLARSLDARLALYEQPVQRFLLLSPLSFDSSVAGIYWTLCQGGELHLPERSSRADPGPLARYVREQGISHLLTIPALYTLLLEQLDGDHALRCAVVAGEACSPALPAQHRARAASAQLWNEYGPTEATVFCSAARCDTADAARVPIGRAVAGARLYVLDSWRRPVLPGQTGELYIGGAGVARGYLGAADATAERFLPDPFGPPGSRMYRSGDWVRALEDGSLEFRGRRDAQVKLRGVRVELAEIEAALAACPQVLRAAADVRGAGEAARLVAYVEAECDPLQLRAALARRLPEALLPQRWVAVSSWPLTPNGKLDRARLPDPVAPALAPADGAPRDALERTLLAAFEHVLGLSGLGRDADFFELGGHSLLAPRLTQHLARSAALDLPLRWVFEARSVSALARRIRDPDDPAAVSCEQLRLAARLPESIRPCAGDVAQRPREVLLTGATGFLGAHLLHELLQAGVERVDCLVRAASKEHGLARIRAELARYQLPARQLEQRVRVLCGDLAAPQLGLSQALFAELAQRIDAIYHNGARVDWNASYAQLAPHNVDATLQLIALACRARPKPLHFISTLSVWPERAPSTRAPYPEAPAESPEGLTGGYAQSKWVAEQLVWQAGERGLPVTIHRPSTIGPHRASGAWNAGDFLCSVLRASVLHGIAAQEDELLYLVPVDDVTRAVVKLAAAGERGIFQHTLAPLGSGTLLDWLRAAGYPLANVPYAQWREVMREHAAQTPEHPLAPFLAQLEHAESAAPSALCFETGRLRRALGTAPAELTQPELARCLTFLRERGLLRLAP